MKTCITSWSVVVLVTLIVPAAAARGDDTPAAVAPVASTASVASPASAWDTDPVLARLNAFYAGTTDFSASFKQVVTTKSPKRTFRRGGKVYFKRPGMMRWDYTEPDIVNYVSAGGLLWAYDSEDGSAIKMNVADSDLYSALGFLSGTTKLSDSFVPEVTAAAVAGHSTVKLVPVKSAGSYRHVVLTVRNETGEVVETEVVDPVGNVSRIRFESVNYVAIPESAFKFVVPAGVKVQDLTVDGAAGSPR